MIHDNIPQHYEEDALPGFSRFRYLTRAGVDKLTMEDLGYVANSRSKFNAFARRLRLAKSMKSVNFEGYGDGTTRGYEALNRHFLMFSAFERYVADCEGVENGVYHLALKHVPAGYYSQLKEAFDLVDINDSIFNFLLKNSNSTAQKISLRAFRDGKSKRSGIYISAMLRNAFVHGVLSANPKGAPKDAIEMLANFMTGFLYNALVLDFKTRMDYVDDASL